MREQRFPAARPACFDIDFEKPCQAIGTQGGVCIDDACRCLFDLIGSERKAFEIFDGLDHVGLIVSKAARGSVWPRIIEFLGNSPAVSFRHTP